MNAGEDRARVIIGSREGDLRDHLFQRDRIENDGQFPALRRGDQRKFRWVHTLDTGAAAQTFNVDRVRVLRHLNINGGLGQAIDKVGDKLGGNGCRPLFVDFGVDPAIDANLQISSR